MPDIQYNGRIYDPSTGFHDYGARLYWPEIGRFVSVDPAGTHLENPASLNRYAYVLNNPYRYVDPDGRSAKGAFYGGMIGGAVGGVVGFILGGGGGVVVAIFTGGVGAPVVPAGAIEGGALGSGLGIIVGHNIGDLLSGDDQVMQASTASTSDAARREAMRQQGIPTSQQPESQSQDEAGRVYGYRVPRPGGGTQEMSVQQQTMDRSHPGEEHWEAGKVKVNRQTGEIQKNQYGRPKLTSDKSRVEVEPQ